MDHQSLAYIVITLRTRHLCATTPDPQRNAAAWQTTLHNELGSGAYKDILRRIGAQTENCPPDPSIAELTQRWSVHDYYKEPNDAEEPQLSLDDIKQRLRAQSVRTDFKPPEGLDYFKTLACIACGINKTLVLGMAEKHEDEVIDILRQTVPELEARSRVGDSALLSSGGSQIELATAYIRPQKARECDSNSEGKTILPLRLKR
ncbi:hypothetical protein NCS52_00876300 [Fusarium sp. LHS14.1]|nr:hypothetical protein NCS52_00876300 [Fusarium sp. LHS14.1]